MEQTLAIQVAYDGSDYHGWQRQSGQRSVQQAIEEVLRHILRQHVALEGSGRTDAGVHARGQVASFSCDLKMTPEKLAEVMNRRLPRDIEVSSIRAVPRTFHARYDAVGKTYSYRIHTGHDKSPFAARYACVLSRPLDLDQVRCAMPAFIGTHDFRAFRASGSKLTDPVRTVTAFEMEQPRPDELIFTITGNGFLYKMVRIIMGTLIHVGQGKKPAHVIPDIIAAGDRHAVRYTAPAEGLYLEKVYYERPLF